MRFFRSSIRNKLIALLLVSAIIPILSSIVITYFYTKDSLKTRAIEENSLLISEVETNISNYLESINKATLSVYSSETLERILTQGTIDYESDSYILATMQLYFHALQDIYKVYLSINENNRSYVLSQDIFSTGQTTYHPPFYDQVTPYLIYIESTHQSHNYGIPKVTSDASTPVFTFHRPLYKVPTTQQIGWLAVDIKLAALQRLSTRLYENGKEDLFILDDKGSVVYASDEALIGQSQNDLWSDKVIHNDQIMGSMDWTQAGFSGIMIYSKIQTSYLKWTVVKRIPYSYLYEHVRKLTLINTIVAAFFLIISIFAILIISFRFTKPIKELIFRISKIQAGQLHEMIDLNRQDEFGVLARKFRGMMQTINDLILREYKLDIANKTNQLKMLQAQINPHFINNSLQSIGHLALEKDAPEVYSLISSLGQMMHYSMDTKETIVTLSAEIDYVQYYLALQQQRFADKLTTRFDIADNALAMHIPKMIIQPIVENFFKHGFDASHDHNHLSIKAFINEQILQIVVEDNGKGISEERLLSIRQDLAYSAQDEGKGDKIGLVNVALRLRFYYGEEAQLELKSCDPQGIRATMTLPVRNIKEALQ